MRRFRVPFFLLVALFVPLTTVIIIQFAKGYSFNLTKKKFEPRGILVANSVPNGARVFIDGEFKSATDNSLPLPPGDYSVEIKKDGFSSWKKDLKIEKEMVVKTEAFLFQSASDFRPITFNGASKPTLSPDGEKIVYANIASPSSATYEQGGLWLVDLSEFPFGLSRKPKQIIKPSSRKKNYAETKISWSPDSRQILVGLGKENYLLDPSLVTSETNLLDISWNLKTIMKNWQVDEEERAKAKFKRLPIELQTLLEKNAADFSFSPDGEKLLYSATASAVIPEKLIPPLPGSSTQKEEREINPGRIYIYDLKEDRNFFITAQPITNLSWFSTSRHLLWVEEGKISLAEYDGTNKTTIFTGNFENSYVFPVPAGNRIIILTNFGQEKNQPPNLYSINLR